MGDECMNEKIVAILIVLVIVIGFAYMIPSNRMDPMVAKIIRGDLPPCETTLGSDSGYYCLHENQSYFCKVDLHPYDIHLKGAIFCGPVVLR